MEVDARGLLCPLPVLRLRKILNGAAPGTRVALLATDAMAAVDVPHFCAEAGHALISVTQEKDAIRYEVMRGDAFAWRAPA
ncbi:sulfurtransferase TusA family protein [uncultured Paracoccus sp.]|uniref:sulfurtransferase TusA family protein n=1 Tax=uncultured Paracoccus sp. TaxID=189685 RepID=UPI0015EE7BC9|nr:sulfurtransferase TusA family protein [uncultured Paracoccus sp.]MBA4490758.1 sulfurtransferase TusA family protein [Paracoccus sp. S1E-3]